MSDEVSGPDIQRFDRDGTWTRPERAVAVVALVVAGGGGGSFDADGQPGESALLRLSAPDIPPTIEIQIGKGGRGSGGGQDGRDGCAVVVTHLEGGDGADPDWVQLLAARPGASSSLPAVAHSGGNGGSSSVMHASVSYGPGGAAGPVTSMGTAGGNSGTVGGGGGGVR